MVECAYQIRQVDYLIETDNSWNTEPVKLVYEKTVQEFRNWQIQCETEEAELDALIADKNSPNYNDNYNTWLYRIRVLAAQEELYRNSINSNYQSYIQTLIFDQEEEAVSEAL